MKRREHTHTQAVRHIASLRKRNVEEKEAEYQNGKERGYYNLQTVLQWWSFAHIASVVSAKACVREMQCV